MKKLFFILALFCSIFGQRKYCVPGDWCWPSQEQIDEFEKQLSPNDDSVCWGLPTFSSDTKQGTPFNQTSYYGYPEEITPWGFLNARQRTNWDHAPFVVLAKNEQDIQEAVNFAKRHDLAIQVFSTGHEFQNRNGGPNNATLLVRTTCLQSSEINLCPQNKFKHEDGIARIGAGLTWGTSLLGVKGVIEIADSFDRVAVSGHAGQVGVVGWSLGGGHGQLVPIYGPGVDQLLEVELINAQGRLVRANANGTWIKYASGEEEYQANSDLFWALRGGGGSSWGIIHHITIKLHKIRNECKKDCIYRSQKIIYGTVEDQGDFYLEAMKIYLDWASTASKWWSGYMSTTIDENLNYSFSFDFVYIGTKEDGDDINSFDKAFENISSDHVDSISNSTFDTWWQYVHDYDFETVYVAGLFQNNPTVLLNSSIITEPDMSKWFFDNSFGRCLEDPDNWCNSGYLFMQTVPHQEEITEDTPLSDAFRQARIHVGAQIVASVNKGVADYTEGNDFSHNVLAQAFYEKNNMAYFSESDSLQKDGWWKHFWTHETYIKLKTIKQNQDPEDRFWCHHCITNWEETDNIIE